MPERFSAPSASSDRLALLRGLGLIGRLSDAIFDRLSAAAALALGAPAVLIGVVDGDTERVLGSSGAEEDAPLARAFCRQVAQGGETTEAPAVEREGASYAGVPLVGADGEPLGFFCAIVDEARQWSDGEMATLRGLAQVASSALDLCLANVLLEAVKEASLDGVLALSLDRRVIAMNQRFKEMWGIPDAALATGSHDALLDAVLSLIVDPEEFLGRVEESYALASEEVRDEIPLVDGRILSRHGVPLLGDAGVPSGRIWHFRDVTEPLRAQQALEESEQRLSAFVESASDAAFAVDEASVVTYANPAVERIFGYSPAELIGRPLTTIIPERLPEKAREGRKRASAVRRIPWGAIELAGRHRDGREIPLEVSFGRFASGGRTFYTGIVRDIAERKQVERVMHDAAVSYRSLFDSLEELVMILDLDGNILGVNEAVVQRHGYSREEILGSTPEMLTAPGWKDTTHATARVLRSPSGQPVRLEWWGRTAAGETFPMDLVLTRGEYFGAPVLIAVGRDTTERREAERALRDSEEKFRQIAENIREDFWIYEPGFRRTIYLSPAHEEVWGTSREVAYQNPRSFLNGVLPEDLPDLLAAMERLDAGEVVRVEYRHRRPDGSVRWAWSRAFPVLDEEGRVYRVVGTTEDITERKEAEQTLRWFGTIVGSSADGIASVSRDRMVTSWNPAAERIFGYRADEIIGRSWELLVPPEEAEVFRRIAADLDEGRAPPPYEAVRVRKDGKRIHVAFTAFPIHDAAERVIGTAAIMRDVTETKAREEQRRLLAAALERLDEGVSIATFAGEIIYANENHARVLGYDPAARPLPALSDFIPEAASAAEHEQILRAVVDKGGWVGRVRRRRLDDGRVVPVELIMGRIDQEGNGPSLLFGIVRDISKQLDQERYLRRAERLASVGTLVGGAAHELNNPLHAVRSFADLMLMEPRPAEDLEALEIIKREADRAAKIVSDLRLFARQTQDESSERTAVDLNDVVRHVCKVRRYSLETRGISIAEELAGGLPFVHANRGEVEQVVVNLVVNAEQALAGVAGERRLRLRTVSGITDVTLMVSDTGPGIPLDLRDRIFDPFFTTKPPGEGTGLGLSIVHGIVSEHGGQIRVDSEPGLGTTFIVELPRAAGSDRRGPEEDPAPAPGRDLSVLLVEDEDAVRRATARYLGRLGYRVDAAAEGGEALRLLDAGRYDIVVSDLRMPGLDGEELLRRLREREIGLDRRLIFLTGDTPAAPGVPQLSAEGIPVLFKPVRLEEVAREISRLASTVDSRSVLPAP